MLTKGRSFRRASLLSVLIGAAVSFFSLTAVAQSSQSGTDEKADSTTASTPEQNQPPPTLHQTLSGRGMCCRPPWKQRNGAGSTMRSRLCCTSSPATPSSLKR